MTAFPGWPLRLRELSQELDSLAPGTTRDRALSEAWLLLNAAILRYIRKHCATLGRVSREDQEDIAATKALDLLRRLDTGASGMGTRQPGEIAGYLSTVARNGILDRLREASRRVVSPLDDREGWDVEDGDGLRPVSSADPPNLEVERRDFVRALRRCVERLAPRARLVWFFRVLCEMPSKEIATHPDVQLKVGHIDVLLQRCRSAIRDCMREQGFEAADMPPGTFVEMWRGLRFEKGSSS